MEVAERGALEHSKVQEGSGVEATSLGGGGGAGGHLQGIQCLWAPLGYGNLLLIPGAGDLGGERRLTGGGQEFVKGKGGM